MWVIGPYLLSVVVNEPLFWASGGDWEWAWHYFGLVGVGEKIVSVGVGGKIVSVGVGGCTVS